MECLSIPAGLYFCLNSARFCWLFCTTQSNRLVDARALSYKPYQDAEMQARIKRKLELQKKAARPMSFTESLASEQQKQSALKKSKEEMRQAMCEELGRGC